MVSEILDRMAHPKFRYNSLPCAPSACVNSC